MRLRSPRVLAVTASVLMIGGAGAALAQAQQSGAQKAQTQQSQSATLGKGAFLDDVADRLGVERSKLDSALKDIALDEVDWALDAGFITQEQADALKERVNAGAAGRFGHFGFGKFGFGGFAIGHLGLGGDAFLAAAQYLDLTVTQLRNALDDKTLAEIARDGDKSVDGLEKALRDAAKADLDDVRTNGFLTQKQEDALLDRLDSNLDDIVNGRSPSVTELAKRLGVERAKLEAALEGAATDQVDEALGQGLITQAQADVLKQRIQSGAGSPFGFGLGCRGGFGLGLRGLGFGHRGAHGFGFGAGALGVGALPARFT